MKAVIVLVLLFISPSSLSQTQIKHSAGIGDQYSILGYQLSLLTPNIRLSASLGFFITSIGAQFHKNIDSKHTIGANITTAFMHSILYSVNYNYYKNGVSNSGIVLSIGAGHYFIAAPEREKTLPTISIGYQF